MSKEIRLSRGMVAVVDDADFDWLNKSSWSAHKGQRGEWYAVHGSSYMHRVIMGDPKNQLVDHKDGNGLNNVRDNLRICSTSQNSHNTRMASNNTSGYKGVSWNKGNKKFQAHIAVNGKKIYIGQFSTAVDAARAYDREAVKLHGEYANINGV